jgi:hypothetical protein
MAVLYTPHFIQFFDDNGDPLANGKLYTYTAGTTTPKSTYTTAAATVANANPIVLDSAGRAVAFLDGSYKFRLETSASVLVRETDNVSAFTTSAVTIDSILPSQTGNAGKFLGTDGISASWTAGGGGIVYLGTATASASSDLRFEGLISSTYNDYYIEINDLLVATNGTSILLQTSDDAGPYTYDTTGYYNITSMFDSNATTYVNAYAAGTDTGIVLADAIGNVTPRSLSCKIKMSRTGVSAFRFIFESGYLDNNGYVTSRRGYGYLGSGNATTAIKIIAGSGNLTSGSVVIMGVQKS